MPRRNHPSPKRSPQHARGKARPQGQHKSSRSEDVAKALRDLQGQTWWTAGERIA